MAPTLVREPFHRDGWVYEEKVDGWRILAYKDGERVRLVSRNGRDHTRRFADLAAAVAKLSARTPVLDGEIAIYDQQLRSRFDWLREPDRAPSPRRRSSWRFDLLYHDRRDLTGRRLVIAAPGWRTSWPAATLSSPYAAWQPMVRKRGARLSCAGTRATSRRTRPARTRAVRRGCG
jgi:hypothetical protein